MSRPHTMFVQSQCLPWVESLYADLLPGVQMRVLSRDADSGAVTLMLRIPPQWHSAGSGAMAARLEWFVLAGDLMLGEQAFHDHCYACAPAGDPWPSLRSGAGAVVILMTDREPALLAAGESPAVDPLDRVSFIDARAQGLESWQKNPHTRYLVGTGVQTLRQDRHSGEITILYSALPFRFMEKRWTHEYVQEMFVIAGEYSINDVGVMRPGAYAWWDPQHLHGPYGSLTGFMMLIRSCGGPLVNVIPDQRVAVDFAAPYRPQLPPELAALASEIASSRCY